jgi:hypothetical protein
MHPMTFREMNRAVFAGQPIPHVLFQPRIEPWYAWHQTFNCLPDGYRDQSLLGLFDDLGCSMRYVHYYTGMPDPVRRRIDSAVVIRERFEGASGVRAYETPFGELVEHYKRTVDETWREVGFPVKAPGDLRKLRWLFERAAYSFSLENFLEGDRFVGDRGEPQFWVPKSPYQALAQQWMKLPDLIYALADDRAEVEMTMRAIDDAYDPLYEQMTAAGVVRILNFGENIHEQLLSPRYFERYLIPFWEKRASQLHRAGICSHVHIDGFFRNLLPYLARLPFDGIEALTPTPQGDVSLEELKEHIGDKILLDGIPASIFLPPYTRDDVLRTAEQVVALFGPRLILGISDELPEGAGVEAIEAVREVAAWCKQERTNHVTA